MAEVWWASVGYTTPSPILPIFNLYPLRELPNSVSLSLEVNQFLPTMSPGIRSLFEGKKQPDTGETPYAIWYLMSEVVGADGKVIHEGVRGFNSQFDGEGHTPWFTITRDFPLEEKEGIWGIRLALFLTDTTLYSLSAYQNCYALGQWLLPLAFILGKPKPAYPRDLGMGLDLPTDVRVQPMDFPSIVPAGEVFQISPSFQNVGYKPGTFEIRTTVDSLKQVDKASIDETLTLSKQFTMPFDNLVQAWAFEAIAEGRVIIPPSFPSIKQPDSELWYVAPPDPVIIRNLYINGQRYDTKAPFVTDRVSFSPIITAVFPAATLGRVDAPDKMKPGDAFTLSFPVINDGYKGDIGVRVTMPGFEKDFMKRVESGVTIAPTLSSEMPVTKGFIINIVPIHLGRNKEIVFGMGKTIEIKPANALFHNKNEINIFGGYEGLNSFTAFVAGKNVRVRGLNVTPGTGPLPFGYAGYMLTGDIGVGKSAEIEYDELYFFRVEATKELAVAREGSLIERAVKVYEYSAVPTPTMLSYSFRSVKTLLTKSATRLEVK